MAKSLLELLQSATSLTKQEFGNIMHDPEATEEDIQEALQQLEEAGGYENLGDD